MNWSLATSIVPHMSSILALPEHSICVNRFGSFSQIARLDLYTDSSRLEKPESTQAYINVPADPNAVIVL